MANILTESAEAYVKKLILEEFCHDNNENNHHLKQTHTVAKAEPRLSRVTLDDRLKFDKKEV